MLSRATRCGAEALIGTVCGHASLPGASCEESADGFPAHARAELVGIGSDRGEQSAPAPRKYRRVMYVMGVLRRLPFLAAR